MAKIKIKRKLPETKYVGSAIQQNHGEDLSHGLLLWNLKTTTAEYIEIENDWGYVTIEVNDGKMTVPPKMPHNPRIRLKLENTSAADVKKVLAIIKQKFNVDEVSLQRINAYTDAENEQRLVLGDIRDPEYQNDLLTKYIQKKYIVTDLVLDKVRYINRTINSKLSSRDTARNITWKPKKFEWSNMFCYGEDNSIDFTDMHGAYGLFSKNASGKCVDPSTKIDIEFNKEEIIKKLGFLPKELE